jgi:hypothetical protein
MSEQAPATTINSERRTIEHFHAILPFQIIEKIVNKPLRIKGVAITAGMSRNFNIYTPEELKAFTDKLASAPVYIEHVSIQDAVGKVTKTDWDGQSLWYEAEIYDDEVADKIRKGLIQHVSVGADYETLDVVDGKIPHGLHNAELSLVAVPGIPETNIQVVESLRKTREQQEFCVFCGKNPAEFLLNCCSLCFEKLPLAEARRQELLEKRKMREQAEPLVAGEYFLGFYQDPSSFMPEHFRTVWLDQPNGVLAVMAKTRSDPARELCQSVFFSKQKWDPNSMQDWLKLHPDYAVAANTSQLQNAVKPEPPKDLGERLVKKPAEPTIPVSEAIRVLEGLLPSPMVERSTMGMRLECQQIRRAIYKLKEQAKND